MKIQVRDDMVPGTVAEDEVRSVDMAPWEEATEISDAVARTIAGWYQSPGTAGKIFAALASGCPVEHGELLDAIASERQDLVRFGRMMPGDTRALDCLGTWVLSKVV